MSHLWVNACAVRNRQHVAEYGLDGTHPGQEMDVIEKALVQRRFDIIPCGVEIPMIPGIG